MEGGAGKGRKKVLGDDGGPAAGRRSARWKTPDLRRLQVVLGPAEVREGMGGV
jgi:hypothetical protein